MKAVQAEVKVVMQDGRPAQVDWRGRRYRLSILEQWRYGGRWWHGEASRDCFLVQAGPLLAELHHEDIPGGRWWLARMQD